jgi:hypothetical protein
MTLGFGNTGGGWSGSLTILILVFSYWTFMALRSLRRNNYGDESVIFCVVGRKRVPMIVT